MVNQKVQKTPLVMFNEVRSNKFRSWVLVAGFVLIIALLGAVIGLMYNAVYFGIALAACFSIGYAVFGINAGDSVILQMSGAKPVTKKEYPYLYHTLEGLAIAANIPTPKAYVIEDSAMNAFATGKDPQHASITVTTGLLKNMNRQELEGVVAHEMSHIKNFDIRFMMLTVVLIGVVTLLSDFLLRSYLWGGKGGSSDRKGGNVAVVVILIGLVLAVLSPLIGELIRFSISRRREYLADANAAVLTRYPPGLSSALKKISRDPDPLVDTANKATANLFISMPFRHEQGFMVRLFSTHPPIQERIRRLEAM